MTAAKVVLQYAMGLLRFAAPFAMQEDYLVNVVLKFFLPPQKKHFQFC
jgi:hypothetical protein